MMRKNKLYAVMNEEQADAARQLAKEARAAYMRRWRAAHPDRVKAINETYWFRRAIKEAKANGWKDLPVE